MLSSDLDLDRIYVENIRSFYDMSSVAARDICDLAVEFGLFEKRLV